MSETMRIPQPAEISEREKDDAMGAYLMMFAAWGIGLPLPLLNLIAAIIYFFVNKKTSRFVAFHSYQSLLSQVPVSLLNMAAVAWLLVILIRSLGFAAPFYVYLIFTALANVLYIVYSVVALMKARRGQFYYMPLFGRLAFARYYGPNAAGLARPLEPNRPPEGF
jgi:uncharacterized membrane protein